MVIDCRIGQFINIPFSVKNPLLCNFFEFFKIMMFKMMMINAFLTARDADAAPPPAYFDEDATPPEDSSLEESSSTLIGGGRR